MITMAATKLFFVKVWEFLKACPQWLWTVLALVVAFLAIQAARRTKNQSEIKQKQADALLRFHQTLGDISATRREKVAVAEERHKAVSEETAKTSEKLEAAKGDTDKITDAVNDAFKGDV